MILGYSPYVISDITRSLSTNQRYSGSAPDDSFETEDVMRYSRAVCWRETVRRQWCVIRTIKQCDDSAEHCYYGSTALCWALAAFSVSWSYAQSVGLLWRGISPSKGLYLHTEQHKYRIHLHNTDIHALSGTRTHDPSVRASEDSSCLRPRGHCDLPQLNILVAIILSLPRFHPLNQSDEIVVRKSRSEPKSASYCNILSASAIVQRHVLRFFKKWWTFKPEI
jgi:hypothetical protein